jgi:hypothetical protein
MKTGVVTIRTVHFVASTSVAAGSQDLPRAIRVYADAELTITPRVNVTRNSVMRKEVTL